MKLYTLSFKLILFFVAAISINTFAVPAKGLIKIQSKADLEKYLKMGKPVVLIFSTDWCSACKASAPQVEWAIQEYPEVLFLLVDGDFPGTKDLKTEYAIGAFPTFILINAKGAKVYQDAHSVSSRGFMEDLLKKITTLKGAPAAASTPAPAAKPACLPKSAVPEVCVNPRIESAPQSKEVRRAKPASKMRKAK